MSTETLFSAPFGWVNNAYDDIQSTRVAENPPCKPPKGFVCSSSTVNSATQLPFPAESILT